MYRKAERFASMAFFGGVFAIFMCFLMLGHVIIREELENNDVKYLAHVEFPNGESETYEVVRYQTYLLGDCVLVLEDGKKIVTQEDRVVIETINRDEE